MGPPGNVGLQVRLSQNHLLCVGSMRLNVKYTYQLNLSPFCIYMTDNCYMVLIRRAYHKLNWKGIVVQTPLQI